MRFECSVEGRADPESVRSRLRDVTRWDWCEAEIRPTAEGGVLRYPTPVPVEVRVEVVADEVGVRLRLVEGDLAQLDGRIEVQPAGGGSRVSAVLELGFRVGVPGTLLRELDQRVLPRWLHQLAQPA